jgi:iron complex transport system substrate-binding protein
MHKRISRLTLLVTALALGAVGASASSLAAAPPQRIVSINLCTDQLLMLLAPRERIAAVSYLAAQGELSPLASRARDLPSVRNSAEEVLALKPDLVLAGTYTSRHTTKLLRAFGIAVLAIPPAEDFHAVRRQLREVAAALHEDARADALIRQFDAKLAAMTQLPRRRAGFYRAGGQTVGKGTLSHTVLSAAQMDNVAALAGLKGFGYMPLERLLIERPQWLIGSDYKRDVPTVGAQVLRHPVLQSLPGGEFIMPGNMIACGGVWSADAVAMLATLGVQK